MNDSNTVVKKLWSHCQVLRDDGLSNGNYLEQLTYLMIPKAHQAWQPTWDEQKNPEGRWRAYGYDEIASRDKASLDIFWLRDESLEDSANLPEPSVIAAEIAEDLEAALGQIRGILNSELPDLP
jgi:type I restriction enzyme M protein